MIGVQAARPDDRRQTGTSVGAPCAILQDGQEDDLQDDLQDEKPREKISIISTIIENDLHFLSRPVAARSPARSREPE